MKQIFPTYSSVSNTSQGSSACAACRQTSSSNSCLSVKAVAFVDCRFSVGTLRNRPRVRVRVTERINVRVEGMGAVEG